MRRTSLVDARSISRLSEQLAYDFGVINNRQNMLRSFTGESTAWVPVQIAAFL